MSWLHPGDAGPMSSQRPVNLLLIFGAAMRVKTVSFLVSRGLKVCLGLGYSRVSVVSNEPSRIRHIAVMYT